MGRTFLDELLEAANGYFQGRKLAIQEEKQRKLQQAQFALQAFQLEQEQAARRQERLDKLQQQQIENALQYASLKATTGYQQGTLQLERDKFEFAKAKEIERQRQEEARRQLHFDYAESMAEQIRGRVQVPAPAPGAPAAAPGRDTMMPTVPITPLQQEPAPVIGAPVLAPQPTVAAPPAVPQSAIPPPVAQPAQPVAPPVQPAATPVQPPATPVQPAATPTQPAAAEIPATSTTQEKPAQKEPDQLDNTTDEIKDTLDEEGLTALDVVSEFYKNNVPGNTLDILTPILEGSITDVPPPPPGASKAEYAAWGLQTGILTYGSDGELRIANAQEIADLAKAKLGIVELAKRIEAMDIEQFSKYIQALNSGIEFLVKANIPIDAHIAGAIADIQNKINQANLSGAELDLKRIELAFVKETGRPLAATLAMMTGAINAINSVRSMQLGLQRDVFLMDRKAEIDKELMAYRKSIQGPDTAAPSVTHGAVARILALDVASPPETIKQNIINEWQYLVDSNASPQSLLHFLRSTIGFIDTLIKQPFVTSYAGGYRDIKSLCLGLAAEVRQASGLAQGGGPPSTAPGGATSGGHQSFTPAHNIAIWNGPQLSDRQLLDTANLEAIGSLGAKQYEQEIANLWKEYEAAIPWYAAASEAGRRALDDRGRDDFPRVRTSLGIRRPDVRSLVAGPLATRALNGEGRSEKGRCARLVNDLTRYQAQYAREYAQILPRNGWVRVRPQDVIPGEDCIIVDPTMANGIGHVGFGVHEKGRLVWLSDISFDNRKKGAPNPLSVHSLSRNAQVFVRRR